MISIPNEALQKYNILTPEQHQEVFPEIINPEEDIYRQYLQKTDYISNKLVEGSFKSEDCADELAYREMARREIAKLNGEEVPEAVEIKTLESRAAESEAVLNALLGTEV